MEKKSVKKNFIYNTMYQLLVIILPLITTPYISRVLGVEMIGTYSYSYSIAYYFIMFIMLGLNNYGNRTIAMVRDNRYSLSKNFWGIYIMQLITSLICVTIYIIYAIFFANNTLTWIFLIYIFSAMFDINWFFFGLEEFKLTVIRNFVIKICTTICIFLFIKKPSDLYLYAIIMSLGVFLSSCSIWPFVKKYVDFTKITFQDIKIHIKPNLILFIPVVAISMYKIMDKIMLGSISNMEQVGYYENTEKIIQVPMAFINSLGTVMLPKMSNLAFKRENKQVEKYFEIAIIFAMFLASSLCFGIMGVADEFVPIFYGQGYEECALLFKILLPSCIFLAFANVLRTQYLIPYKEDSIYIKSIIFGAIVNLLINILLIPKFGSVGASIGTFFAEASVCMGQIVMLRKKIINLKKYLLESMVFVIAGIVMFIILNLFPKDLSNIFLRLCLKIIIGGIIYIALIGSFIIIYQKFKRKELTN